MSWLLTQLVLGNRVQMALLAPDAGVAQTSSRSFAAASTASWRFRTSSLR